LAQVEQEEAVAQTALLAVILLSTQLLQQVVVLVEHTQALAVLAVLAVGLLMALAAVIVARAEQEQLDKDTLAVTEATAPQGTTGVAVAVEQAQ
jgi:hypothetical protein